MAETKKKYKFITIENKASKVGVSRQYETFEGKPAYRIYNNRGGDQIGIISWYKPWRQYVFSSQPHCVFNNSCLKDVIDFMETEADRG